MNKIAVALALLSASGAMAATACDSKLATVLGVPTTNPAFKTTSAAVTGLKYCTHLAADSCCEADTINNFQTKITALVKEVSDEVADRDVFLIKQRKESLADITSTLNTLKKSAASAIAKLGSAGADDTLDAFEADLDFLTGSISELVSSFSTYQKNRVTCANSAIKLQAGALCLACDPALESQGVTLATGSIALSDSVKTTLLNDCYPYLSSSDEQNSIIKFKYIADRLTAYKAALDKIASEGTQATVTAFTSLVNGNVVTTIPTDDSEKPAVLPTDCDSKDCDFITTTLWAAIGGVDADVLAAGGNLIEYTKDDDENENESETEDNNNRLLATTGSFTPDYTKVGIDVNFPENPGNVVNKGAQLIEGAVVCAGVLAMGLLI